MGIRGSDTHSIHFTDVKVPKENRIGKDGFGFKYAMLVLNGGRIGIAAQALGIAGGAYERSLQYAGQRRAFGKPIINHQAIQFKLVDMATRIEASRLLVYKAALDKDNNRDYAISSAMAKVFASETAMWTATEAVQIHGGYGYEGTSEVQRIVIGRSLSQ